MAAVRLVFAAAVPAVGLRSGLSEPILILIGAALATTVGWGAVAAVGVVIFASGFMLFSQVNSLLTFYLAFVVMSMGASLAGRAGASFMQDLEEVQPALARTAPVIDDTPRPRLAPPRR